MARRRSARALVAAGYAVIGRYGPSVWYASPRYPGWQHAALVRDALCADGKRRTVYLGNDADTFFSWPGRVKIAGLWQRGFVMTCESNVDGRAIDTVFHARTTDATDALDALDATEKGQS